MKVYVSVDIEGVAGAAHWDEAEMGKPGYEEFRAQMTAEAAAACEGALEAGATEIVVKDAHWTGRNILADKLPESVRLIRGWSGHPDCMVQDIDESFDALAMIGYHSAASAGRNPLAHTITGDVTEMILNGEQASEFLLHRHAAARYGVPAVFFSGDQGICDVAAAIEPGIRTVATKESAGGSVTTIHPARACTAIRRGMHEALEQGPPFPKPDLPANFELAIRFKDHAAAYTAAFYPGARLAEPHVVAFETSDFFEIMRMLAFVLP